MIVHNFDAMRTVVFPNKTNPSLAVDPDTVLQFTIYVKTLSALSEFPLGAKLLVNLLEKVSVGEREALPADKSRTCLGRPAAGLHSEIHNQR
jgi:hypothetical protein